MDRGLLVGTYFEELRRLDTSRSALISRPGAGTDPVFVVRAFKAS